MIEHIASCSEEECAQWQSRALKAEEALRGIAGRDWEALQYRVTKAELALGEIVRCYENDQDLYAEEGGMDGTLAEIARSALSPVQGEE